MSHHANLTRISTRARVLKAVRWYFRATGMSPSFWEIGLRAGVPKQRVGRYLEELRRDEYLTYAKGEARSIALADPGANLSDEQLRAACAGRGCTIVVDEKLTAVGDSFPVDTYIPDWAADVLGQLEEWPPAANVTQQAGGRVSGDNSTTGAHIDGPDALPES